MDIKSILLGIGFGIIFTATIGIIYSKGDTYTSNKEPILSKSNVENSESGFVVSDRSSDKTKLNVVDSLNVKTNNNNKKQESFYINIENGDSSEIVGLKLKENGVISNNKEFEDEMVRLDKVSSIRIGRYSFKKNEDLSEIIDKITKIK
jgi:hypothetical protein